MGIGPDLMRTRGSLGDNSRKERRALHRKANCQGKSNDMRKLAVSTYGLYHVALNLVNLGLPPRYPGAHSVGREAWATHEKL